MSGDLKLKRLLGHKCLQCGQRLQQNRFHCNSCIKKNHAHAQHRMRDGLFNREGQVDMDLVIAYLEELERRNGCQ